MAEMMRQLNYIGPRKLEWREVPKPSLPDGNAVLVKPLTVATCDMDGVVIMGLLPLRGPTPLGHEGEGVVIEVGDDVTKWQPGDRVIIPWKIACGTCSNCGRGKTAQCSTVPPEDAYGWGPTSPQWGGFLSGAIVVPFADHMLTRLPAGVDPTLAAGVADNISDGWRAVAPHLEERPGGTVLVVGMAPPGSIGLYAAGIAVSLGSERVVYCDHDQTRLAIAEKMGCETMPLDLEQIALLATDRRSLAGGFDITVDASGNPQVLPHLIAATARAGVCVSTAGIMYRTKSPTFDVYDIYRKSMSFHTGWVHTQTLIDRPLELIANGIFDPSPVTTIVSDWDDCIDPLTNSFTKVIISREE